MMEMAGRWPRHCKPMMGLHPVYVKDNFEDELRIVRDWLERESFIAVGEIGLDKYWDLSFLDAQQEAFTRQIDWALEFDLPIVIHSRESTRDCIEIVKQKQQGMLRGVFHCFVGTLDEAREIMDLGFYLGIGGVVTFKNSQLGDIVKATGLERVVLETDAPYLAPVPYRGKRNESSYIPLVARKLSEVTGLSMEDVAELTTANAEKVFGKSAK